MASKHKVIIRRCPDYDDMDRIRGIIREGMEQLGAKPYGKVLLKYNLVFAHRKHGKSAYTHPNVLESLIDVLAEKPDVEKVILGERTGIYVPTRYHFNVARFNYLAKKPKVSVCFFDEDKLVNVHLEKATYHKSCKFSKTLMRADYKVWAPKLKHHVSTRLTCALKLNIGICDQKQRLDGHDWRLEEKIADLYEVGHPDFISVDAVDIGQQNEIFPKPLRLGVMVMGSTSVAVDSVAARLIGYDPEDIMHLRIVRERGWQPVSDDQIEIESEVPWGELMDKIKDFDYSYGDLSKLDTPLRFHFGNYPGGNEPCWGGCFNMLKGALAGFETFSPGSLKKSKPIAIVVGEYDGDVDGQGHPILLVGKCTKINGKVVNGRTRRVPGCPVGIPIFTAMAPYFMKIPSPFLSEPPTEAVVFARHAATAYLNKFINRVF